MFVTSIASLNNNLIFRELAQIFHLDDYLENLKTGILVDLYYYTIQFSRDNQFSKEQTSAFFSILKKTHDICIGVYDTSIWYTLGQGALVNIFNFPMPILEGGEK